MFRAQSVGLQPAVGLQGAGAGRSAQTVEVQATVGQREPGLDVLVRLAGGGQPHGAVAHGKRSAYGRRLDGAAHVQLEIEGAAALLDDVEQ